MYFLFSDIDLESVSSYSEDDDDDDDDSSLSDSDYIIVPLPDCFNISKPMNQSQTLSSYSNSVVDRDFSLEENHNSLSPSKPNSFNILQPSPCFYVSAVQGLRKYCRKRRNCSLPAISPFPTVFSKDLYCRQRKNQGLFGKGLKHNCAGHNPLFMSEWTCISHALICYKKKKHKL